LVAGAFVRGSKGFYREQRITDVSGPRAAYEVCVRIPFGTALPEEAIFRGALLGLFSRYHSPAVASGVTSLLFGFWHLAPTLRRLPTHGLTRSRPAAHQAAWIAGAVAVTGTAGVLLSWLRVRSGSIVAPWLVHSAVNSAGYTAAWLSHRSRPEDARGRDVTTP
ncbi:MAG TPA: CPBP family intramembrane glutamic endopeptidase, partial [Dehalococcoidia bacterium]|jgi:membrane protease YdiL (CAAX protease family)|nr:CPBP family intramembrane glutamic endopeptidase [Dehalococcoidia bacterium]